MSTGATTAPPQASGWSCTLTHCDRRISISLNASGPCGVGNGPPQTGLAEPRGGSGGEPPPKKTGGGRLCLAQCGEDGAVEANGVWVF